MSSQATGWTMQLYNVPSGTGQTPVAFPAEALIGTSNLPQTINFNGPSEFQKFVPKCTGNLFSWRFFGKIQISTAGDYTFCISSDDGSELFLNSQPIETQSQQAPVQYSLLVDDDGLHGTLQRCSPITLGAGSYYTQVVIAHYISNSSYKTKHKTET